MTIKDTKTRVTFVTENETLEDIKRLVKKERKSGRKMTVSRYIDEVLRQHVESRDFFGVNNWPG